MFKYIVREPINERVSKTYPLSRDDLKEMAEKEARYHTQTIISKMTIEDILERYGVPSDGLSRSALELVRYRVIGSGRYSFLSEMTKESEDRTYIEYLCAKNEDLQILPLGTDEANQLIEEAIGNQKQLIAK